MTTATQPSSACSRGRGAKDAKADWRRGEAVFDFDGELSDLTGAFEGSHYAPSDIESLEARSEVSSLKEDDVDYDLVMIGAGSAAFAAAIRATGLGARVAIVERDTVGGTCVNVGCIPSKNLLAASEAYRTAGHHPFAGISTTQQGVDMSALIGAKADVVSMLRKEKYLDLAAHYGFELIE